MTLVAGFVCADGCVIAADTEVELGNIRYQAPKLLESDPTKDYRVVIGGAGHTDYIESVSQTIQAAIANADHVTLNDVHGAILDAIVEIHEDNIFQHWDANDEKRPMIDLIVMARDIEGKIGLWKTTDKVVRRVLKNAFIGTGAVVAEHVSEKLFVAGMPTAVVHHLATQIIREAKLKASGVGGNTDTWSLKTPEGKGYFEITVRDDSFLWGMDVYLASAVRCAFAGRTEQMVKRITTIQDRLATVAGDASRPPMRGDEWHTLEISRKEHHP